MATNATEKQTSYMLQLANKLTGQSARYASQSALDLSVKTSAEASAVIDELQAAIEAHAKWQAETGIFPGAKIRRRYVRKDGTPAILSGEVTGYKWGWLMPVSVYVDLDDEAKGGFPATATNFAIERIGDEVAADPESLRAERARLAARIAEIDAILARS